MNNSRTFSIFRYSPYFIRRKQTDVYDHSVVIKQGNYFQYYDDASFVHSLAEKIIAQSSSIINKNSHFYTIFLLLLTVFYIYYMITVLREKINLLDDSEQYHYFDNYECEIPLVLWFKKGHRLQ